VPCIWHLLHLTYRFDSLAILDHSMIDHSDDSPHYQTMTNLLSPSASSSSSSSITTYSSHPDHCPSSVYHHPGEVLVSSRRSSALVHQGQQRQSTMDQTDSDGDLDSSSSSSCVTHSSKLKKRRANLPKDSVSFHVKKTNGKTNNVAARS
jgi:hypothetical protein